MNNQMLSEKQLNFARIAIVCLDILKLPLQDTLNIFIKPKELDTHVKKCSSLCKGDTRLNSDQKKKCRNGPNGEPDYKQFDVTLCYKLIRNVCSLPEPHNKWGNKPNPTDQNISDDIERIREFRNTHFAHAECAEISDDEFNVLWKEAESIIKRCQIYTTRNHGCRQDYKKMLEKINRTKLTFEEYTSLKERSSAIYIMGEEDVCYEKTAHFEAEVNLEEDVLLQVSWERRNSHGCKEIDIDSTKYKGSNNRELFVHDLCKKDEARYRAVLSRSQNNKIYSNEVYLRVLGEKPFLEDLRVTSENNEIQIHYQHRVSVKSPNVTDIRWEKNECSLDLKNSKYFGGSYKENCLKIKCPEEEDSGLYTCTIINAAGSVTKKTALGIPSAIIDANKEIVFGSKNSFKCTITSCPSPVRVEWEKSVDGLTFSPIDIKSTEHHGSSIDPTSPKLLISDANLSHQQYYRISAWNLIGKCTSNKIFLQVIGDRPFITSGRSCLIDSSINLSFNINVSEESPPVDSVKWIKDGKEVKIKKNQGKYSGGNIDDPSLTINEVNKNDAGNYRLIAINPVGETESDEIILGDPVIDFKSNDKTEDGRVCIRMTVKSIPVPRCIKWSMKKTNSEPFQQINVNSSEYKGTSHDFPCPVLVVKDKAILEKCSFKIEVQNAVGIGEKIITDEMKSSQIHIEEMDSGDAGTFYVGNGTGFPFAKMIAKIANKFPSDKITMLKTLIQSSFKIGEIKEAASAGDYFCILQKEKILTPKDVIPMQYILIGTECEELERICIEYAKNHKAVYFFEIPAGNGYQNVHFHFVIDLQNLPHFRKEDERRVRETVANIVGCKIDEVGVKGYLSSTSFILVLSFKRKYVKKLLALEPHEKDELSKLRIDFFKVGSETVFIESLKDPTQLKNEQETKYPDQQISLVKSDEPFPKDISEEYGVEDIVLEIDNLIKEALSVYLLERIGSSSLCSHFAAQPVFKRKAFNKQEMEILSHGTVQAKNLTRHLLFKLIKYTLPAENHITGSKNPTTTSTAFTFEDVERLHQQHVITDITFKEYETLNDSIFPAIERLTNGEMTSKSTTLTIQLLAYLLKTYADEDFHAFIICLLLAKDEFISRNNISDLIDLLNSIRVSLSLVPVAKNPESVNLGQYLNNDTRHFICSGNGCVSFISQNAMDSVFLAFKDLFKLKKIPFDLLLVNRRFLGRYCRTAEYREKKNELCVHLSSCQTEQFLFCLGSDIIDHPVLEDKTTHAIVCKRYNVPPEVSKIGHEAINSFVKHLQNGKQTFYHARGMVVGCAGAGKTTLLERMKRRNVSDSVKETRAIHVNEYMFSIQKDKSFVGRLCETMINIGLEDNTINRRLSEKTISMLDFAGQCGYYASHHIYFNRRSFFILVIDLTKSLDSVVEDTGNEGTIFEQWTYKEFVLFWMKSIHTYSSESAPVILVWTHADKVENAEEEMSKSFEQIKEMLKNEDRILLRHICKSMCFSTGMPLKQFLLWECDPFRKTIEKIKTGIIETSMQLDHWGMDIPNLWAVVERHIKEACGRSLKIMYVQDLWIQNEDIYTTLHMKEKSELEKILIFFHEVGEILYFPEKGLNEFAILDIQWFSDAFKYIITDLRHAYSDLEDEIKNHTDYTFFTKSGEMSFRLLEKIWDSFKGEHFLQYQKELTKYMERLGMLTRITVFRKDIRASYKVRQRWYVPCMNRRIFNCDDFMTYSAVSSILCFEFQFLPNMLFYKLISSCMDTEWRILTDSKNKCLYQRVAVFYRLDCFIFVGISRNRIEVQVRNLEEHASRKQRADIRAELERKFHQIIDNFHTDLHFQIGYMCSNTKFCDSNCADMLPEAIAQQRVLCNLCPVTMKHYISVSDLSWKAEHDCAKFFLPGAEISDHRDFELLLDVVAGKVSSDMRMIAASLSLDQDAVEQILQDRLHFFIHERNFQVLYHWRNKHRGVIDILYKALIENDRADIVVFLKNFSRNHYKCPGVIEPDLEMTSTDIRLVSREILHEYTRLARFLRLPQQKIERIKMKFRYNINDCIMPTLDLLRNITRQDLCNSLVFISRMDITEKLLESWS